MTNVPVGPNRVSPAGHSTEDAPKEPWRETVAASSRSAGNSFKASARQEKRGFSKLKLIAIAVGVLLLAGALFFFVSRQSNPGGLVDSSKYQAVFFTNGQVYFGKLSSIGGDYYKLTDIYYIQAKEAAASNSENPQNADNGQKTGEPQLVKLGEEIHGPDDAMIINRDQVLFFENLKKDGKVTDAITKYHATKQ